jgi:hypothetical protein
MATHYVPRPGSKATACGRIGAIYVTAATHNVDCRVCWKTVEYKLAVRREACGAVKMGEYDMLRCVSPKGHTGKHNYVVLK